MRKELYEIREVHKSSIEVYHMSGTREEISKWCKMKREAYGYIEGVGGDKKYECFAILIY